MILKILKLVVNWFTVTICCDPIFSCIVVGSFVGLLALMSFLNIFLLVFAVYTLSCTDIKYLTWRARSTLFTIFVERLVDWTLLDKNVVLFEFLNLIFVLLLTDGSPNVWICCSIHVIQILRDKHFFCRINAVMIQF